MIFPTGFGEQGLRDVIDVAVRIVEAAGEVVIFAGAAIAFYRFVLVAFRREGMAPFAPVRLDLGRFLALDSSSSRLRTSCAPRWHRASRCWPSASVEHRAIEFERGKRTLELLRGGTRSAGRECRQSLEATRSCVEGRREQVVGLLGEGDRLSRKATHGPNSPFATF
jgi:hypothetical protein